jgi:hypothetical protein
MEVSDSNKLMVKEKESLHSLIIIIIFQFDTCTFSLHLRISNLHIRAFDKPWDINFWKR